MIERSVPEPDTANQLEAMAGEIAMLRGDLQSQTAAFAAWSASFDAWKERLRGWLDKEQDAKSTSIVRFSIAAASLVVSTVVFVVGLYFTATAFYDSMRVAPLEARVSAIESRQGISSEDLPDDWNFPARKRPAIGTDNIGRDGTNVRDDR